MKKVFALVIAAIIFLAVGIQIGKNVPDSLPTPTPSKKENSLVGLEWGIVTRDKLPSLSWHRVVEKDGNAWSGYHVRDTVHIVTLKDGSKWTVYESSPGPSVCVDGEVSFCLFKGYDPWVRMEFNHYYETMGYDWEDVVRVAAKGRTLYFQYVGGYWYVGY